MLIIIKIEKSFYEILDISEDADISEIKKAYKKLAKLYHPDILASTDDPELKSQAEKQMIMINNAKDILLDPKEREIYDLRLEALRSGKDDTTLMSGTNIAYEPEEINIEWDMETASESLGEDDIESIDSIDSEQDMAYNDLERDYGRDTGSSSGYGYNNGYGYGHGYRTSEVIYQPPAEHAYHPGASFTDQQGRVLVYCPRCGAKNSVINEYCFNCYIRLVPKPSPPAQEQRPGFEQDYEYEYKYEYEHEQEPVPPGSVLCPGCGAVNDEGNQYCASCYKNLISTTRTGSGEPGSVRIKNAWKRPASDVQTYETKRCHSCGAENKANEEYCYNCKANLAYYKPSPQQYPVEHRDEYILNNTQTEFYPVKCIRCGADNYENTEYCYNCHTRLSGAEEDNAAEIYKGSNELGGVEGDGKDPTQAAVQECPVCSHEVYPEQTYCYYCGLKFSD